MITGIIQKRKPLVAVMCNGSVVHGRVSQIATEQFLHPIIMVGGSIILVPAISGAVDAQAISKICDALLLTGSWTNVSPSRYGMKHDDPEANPGRDEIALSLAYSIISQGKPVLGICLGMQELNVLYGGTLQCLGKSGLHMMEGDWRDAPIFEHVHNIEICSSRMQELAQGRKNVEIVSAHRQGVKTLGSGLNVEARAPDGLVEAFAADNEGRVCGVQWHPERLHNHLDRALFENLIKLA